STCRLHRRQSLVGVLERRQHLEAILCSAGQHYLVVGEFKAVIPDNHQPGPHAEETSDRQNYVWLLAVARHQEIVNLANRLVGIIDDAAADDLGSPITGCHLLHIDFTNLYRLWNALRICVCGENGNAKHSRTHEQSCLLHEYSPWPLPAV